MFDSEEGQDQIVETEEVQTIENSPEAETTSTESDSINPVWDPIRQELGLQFETIKPHLLEIDKGFNKGVTDANAKYTPWKAFDEQGITPDTVNQAFATLQRLNDNPEEAYQAFRQYLEENGRLPENAAEAAEALEDLDETPEQKELRELREKVSGFEQFQTAQAEQQERDKLNQAAEQSVAQEYDAFDAAHPDLDPAVRNEVLNRHYLYAASGPQNIKSLEEVFAEVDKLKQAFAPTPRPNDLAPRLPGTGGGVPSGETKKIAELSSQESQALLAGLVERNRSN